MTKLLETFGTSVSTTPGRIWQHECDGWYIYSALATRPKSKTCNASLTTFIWD